MNLKNNKVFLATILLTFLAIAGCINLDPKADPTRYYDLTAQRNIPLSEMTSNLSIGIARVQFPQYLHRTQMVLFCGTNKTVVEEFNRWNEPLESSVPRILAEDLSMNLKTGNVNTIPFERSNMRDFDIHLNIFEFKPSLDTYKVLLYAQWHVVKTSTKSRLTTENARICVPFSIDECDYSGLAYAMSEALALLSDKIATSITLAQ